MIGKPFAYELPDHPFNGDIDLGDEIDASSC